MTCPKLFGFSNSDLNSLNQFLLIPISTIVFEYSNLSILTRENIYLHELSPIEIKIWVTLLHSHEGSDSLFTYCNCDVHRLAKFYMNETSLKIIGKEDNFIYVRVKPNQPDKFMLLAKEMTNVGFQFAYTSKGHVILPIEQTRTFNSFWSSTSYIDARVVQFTLHKFYFENIPNFSIIL